MNDRAGLWEQHAAELRVEAKSPNTLRDRRFILDRLSRYGDLSDITEADVMLYLGNAGLEPVSRRTYGSHIRAFYTWAIRRRHLTHNPAADLPHVKVNQPVPNPIDRGQLARAIAEADPLMRVWLMLAGYAGLRCCEIASMRGENVRQTRLVVLGKGNKERAVALHPLLRAELETWPTTGWLFPRTQGGHIDPKCVSERINRYLRRKGIGWTAHKLRHRFATDLLSLSGGNLRTVQDALGHASIMTTERYTRVDPYESAAAIALIHYDIPEGAA